MPNPPPTTQEPTIKIRVRRLSFRHDSPVIRQYHRQARGIVAGYRYDPFMADLNRMAHRIVREATEPWTLKEIAGLLDSN
jgi:hypothetical protein